VRISACLTLCCDAPRSSNHSSQLHLSTGPTIYAPGQCGAPGIVGIGDVVKRRLDEVQFEVEGCADMFPERPEMAVCAKDRAVTALASGQRSLAYPPIRREGSFIEP